MQSAELPEHTLTRRRALELRGHDRETIEGNGHANAPVAETGADPSPVVPADGAKLTRAKRAKRLAEVEGGAAARLVDTVAALAGAGLVVSLTIDGATLEVRSGA